jgi:threonine aldolase
MTDGFIDLRSDTVTEPSDAMREAMAAAQVGDDWYGDDPTVNALQERATEITGKEAALYVASGTMANQLAMHIHCRPGHVVACEEQAHVATTEAAAAAVLSGVSFRRIPGGPNHLLDADAVARHLEPDRYDVEFVDVLALENTHQAGGGAVMQVDEMRAIRKVADDFSLPIHLDGARIFNAAVALGVDVREIADQVDTLMFCLSKGLGAPIGSILCGSREFIRDARRMRIVFGGAWRQAGIVAAAGLIALEQGPRRLVHDHARARRLADGIAQVLPEALDPETVQTNIVFVEVESMGLGPFETIQRMRDRHGVLCTDVAGRLRMVTHVGISDEDVDRAIRAMREVAGR